MCFPRIDALIDMQHDLSNHVTSRDLELRSHFDIDLLKWTCIFFDASRQEEHDGAHIMSLAFLVQKLFEENIFLPKKRCFDTL